MSAPTSFTRRIIPTVVLIIGLHTYGLAQFEVRSSTAGQPPSTTLAVGDFDGDGKLDVADATNSLQIFLGNGDGTFRSPTNYLSSTGTLFVTTADFNGDGKLDLAVSDLNGLYILLGNGDGTFQTPTLFQTLPCNPLFIGTGDFNGDKKLDLLVTGSCSYFSIFLGNGDGTFQPTPINTTPPYGAPTGVGIGDFNTDGRLDVAVGQQFGTISQVQIFLGNGDGTFSTGAFYNVGSSPEAIAVSDFNNDGRLDLAVTSLLGSTNVFLGNGDGTFRNSASIPTIGTLWVIAADFNRDGKSDLAMATLGNNADIAGIYVAFGNGDGTFPSLTFYPAVGEARILAGGDFNNDHMTDLLAPDYGTGNMVLLLNTGVVKLNPTTPIQFAPQLIGTESSPQTVSLTNTGKSTLSITRMSTHAPFQETNTCGSSVAPGATCDINIVFRPNTSGNASGLLNISDSASSKLQIIELSGAGTVVAFSPNALTFPTLKVGTQATKKVKLTNRGQTSLNITLIYTSGTDYHDFTQTNDCPTSLGAGAYCTISVTFSPLKTGNRSAILGVEDDGGGSPQTIPLTGVGD
ncbi:MAG TPA: FG-GAP-like repeat-containing protein [Terriglobales bacterium]|nr:FG-GAP-like repeat-containing protein [Terriglobales bacterium]